MIDRDKSCHNVENNLYLNIAGKRHEGDGLKAQKQLAQGNALGKRVTRYAPRRGKSKRNAMSVKRFCPYRTLETLRIHPRAFALG